VRKETALLILAILAGVMVTATTAQAASSYAYAVEITDTNFLPSTIYAGDLISLKLSVYNRNSSVPVADLKAEISLGDEFEAVTITDSTDYISQRSTKTLLFQFRAKESTLPGYYPALINFSYTVDGATTNDSYSVQVPVSMSGKNLDVAVSPTVINPGKQTEMVFEIKNISQTSVSNISFSWTEENDLVLPLGTDNKRYVSIINAGKSTIVTYLVAADPNIEPGIYPLDISMSFSDAEGIKSQTSQVGLIVGGGTDFEISAEMSSANQISISIANVGSNNAGAVVVRIPDQEGIKVSGSSASILGNLNEGDYTLANFTVTGARASTFTGTKDVTTQGTRQRPGQSSETQTDTTQKLPSGPRTLKIEVDYTDTTGERHTVEKTLEIDMDTASMQAAFTGTKQQGFNIMDYSLYIVIGIVVIAGVVYFKKIKK